MILSAITKKECIMESYICGKTKISLIMRDDFETVPLRHGMYVILLTNRKWLAQHCPAAWATAELFYWSSRFMEGIHANMLCGRPVASFAFVVNVRSSLCPFISVFLTGQSTGQSSIDHCTLTADFWILYLFYLVLHRIWFFSAGFDRMHFQIRPGPEPGLDFVETT